MNRVFKLAVVATTLAATTLTALPSAYAGDGWRRHNHQDRHNGNGDLVAAGIIGLAVGAIAAGIATAPKPDYYEPVYREPRPRPRPDRTYYYQQEEPDVVYLDGPVLDAWSPEWYRYCEDTYRTFNPRTGTFVGYDGRRHFCVAD